jgi:hypothetical protein
LLSGASRCAVARLAIIANYNLRVAPAKDQGGAQSCRTSANDENI